MDPYGRRSAVAKLVKEFVSIDIKPAINMKRMYATRVIALEVLSAVQLE